MQSLEYIENDIEENAETDPPPPQSAETQPQEELVLPPEQHWVFFILSISILGTATYAVYRKLYVHAILTYCIALTSMNYWRHPLDNWRRYLDMFILFVGFSYHIYTAIYSRYQTIYFSIVAIGIVSYILSLITYKTFENSWVSCIFHIIVHICANASNIVLYKGL